MLHEKHVTYDLSALIANPHESEDFDRLVAIMRNYFSNAPEKLEQLIEKHFSPTIMQIARIFDKDTSIPYLLEIYQGIERQLQSITGVDSDGYPVSIPFTHEYLSNQDAMMQVYSALSQNTQHRNFIRRVSAIEEIYYPSIENNAEVWEWKECFSDLLDILKHEVTPSAIFSNTMIDMHNQYHQLLWNSRQVNKHIENNHRILNSLEHNSGLEAATIYKRQLICVDRNLNFLQQLLEQVNHVENNFQLTPVLDDVKENRILDIYTQAHLAQLAPIKKNLTQHIKSTLRHKLYLDRNLDELEIDFSFQLQTSVSSDSSQSSDEINADTNQASTSTGKTGAKRKSGDRTAVAADNETSTLLDAVGHFSPKRKKAQASAMQSPTKCGESMSSPVKSECRTPLAARFTG